MLHVTTIDHQKIIIKISIRWLVTRSYHDRLKGQDKKAPDIMPNIIKRDEYSLELI